ncbi:MAG: hypothetical protein ACRD19_09155 [Terriglobia bacterium]
MDGQGIPQGRPRARRVARGRGRPWYLLAITVRLENPAADVALHLVEGGLAIREIGEAHIEPAVRFLENSP